MRASHLTTSLLPPGRVVAWRVTPTAEQRVLATEPDPRPLTADQVAHLASAPDAEPGTPDVAPWIGLMCRLPDSTRPAVATMLERYLDRHESLRCLYAEDPERPGELQRHVVPAGTVQFAATDLADTTTHEDSHALVSAHLAREARCDRWPYAGFVTIEHDGATTFVAAFDHLTFDGYSVYVTTEDLLTLHGQDPGDVEVPVGSHLSFAEHEARSVAELTVGDEPLAAWARSLLIDGRLPGLPVAVGVDRDEPALHELESIVVATSQEAAVYEQFCRESLCPMGIGFLSLLVHTAATLEPEGRLDVLMATHNRFLAQWHRAVGWFAGVAPLSVQTEPGDGLAETMRRTAENWMAAQSAGLVRMPMVNRMLDAQVEPALVVSFMDGRRAPGWQRWDEVDARVLLGPVAASTQVHLWVSYMPTGVFLEARYPQRPESAAWVREVAAGMRALLVDTVERLQSTAADAELEARALV